MGSSDYWKRNVEDSVKDGLIITATTTGIFYVLKAANVKPPKASVPGCYGYHETCWWNSGWCLCQRLCSLQKMDQRVIQQTFYGPPKGNKITRHHRLRGTYLSYFVDPLAQATALDVSI